MYDERMVNLLRSNNAMEGCHSALRTSVSISHSTVNKLTGKVARNNRNGAAPSRSLAKSLQNPSMKNSTRESHEPFFILIHCNFHHALKILLSSFVFDLYIRWIVLVYFVRKSLFNDMSCLRNNRYSNMYYMKRIEQSSK
jgi:hypothetical protein